MCILRVNPARFQFMKLGTDGATIYTSTISTNKLLVNIFIRVKYYFYKD